MEKDFAMLVLNSCFRSSRELGETARMVKQFSSEKEGKELKLQIVLAMAEIGAVTQYIYRLHPDLESRVDEAIEKYGRLS
jgi:hypothetical protein